MTSEERAWLAGLLEGEGYFRTYRGRPSDPHASLLVGLQMNDLDIIERAKTLMGCKGKIHKRKRPDPRHNDSYTVVVSGLEAEDVMRTVRPLMGERRKAQIDTALATTPYSHQGAIERMYRSDKRCPDCKLLKPLTEFHRCTRSLDGRYSYCKNCASNRRKAIYWRDKGEG